MNALVTAAKAAAAGAAGVWAMDRLGWSLYRREDPDDVQQEVRARVHGQDVAHAMAAKLAKLAGAKRAPDQPNSAELVIHYALGVVPAIGYAQLRHRAPAVAAAHGAPYGFALFALNDEVIAPAIGVASGPRGYPWQAHARGLVSHLALGVVTEVVLDAVDPVR